MPRPIDPNSPATRIRAALQAVNRSAADLARVCGFSRQNMQRFLDGEITRSKYYPAIAKELDVSLTWLLTGDPMHAPTWWQPETLVATETPGSQVASKGTEGHPSLHATEFPSHWRRTSVPHCMVLSPALAESQVLLDPSRTPKEGDLVLIPSNAGSHLRRLGPTIGDRLILVAVDGSCAIETRPAPLANSASVVVGVLFPDRDDQVSHIPPDSSQGQSA